MKPLVHCQVTQSWHRSKMHGANVFIGILPLSIATFQEC